MALPKWTEERTAQLTNLSVAKAPYPKLLLQKQLTSLKPLLVLSLANCERWVMT